MAKKVKDIKKKAETVQKGEKEKKITVKFFLNKALQPVMVNNTKKSYPLYMLITYDRKNTMLKSYYGLYYVDLKEAAQNGLTAFEEKMVKKTITYERGLAGSKFTLKGLHKKYDQYCVSLHLLFEKYLKGKLFRLVMSTKPHEFSQALNFSNPNVSFDTLYTIAKKIYPDFSLPDAFRQEAEAFHDYSKLYDAPFFAYNFPTAIEWLDQSAQTDYRKKLEVVYKADKKTIDGKIALVDKIVQSSLS